MKATGKKDNDIRELYFSDEFVKFYDMLQDKAKAKFEHTMDVIRTEYVLSTWEPVSGWTTRKSW